MPSFWNHLNLTGGRLLAFCYVDPDGWGTNKAFYSKRQPYFQLQWRKTPASVTVASEPLTREGGWRGLRHGQLLVVNRLPRSLQIRTFSVGF